MPSLKHLNFRKQIEKIDHIDETKILKRKKDAPKISKHKNTRGQTTKERKQ